jgi:hypothetical protein
LAAYRLGEPLPTGVVDEGFWKPVDPGGHEAERGDRLRSGVQGESVAAGRTSTGAEQAAQAFRLSVSPEGIAVAGGGDAGRLYAVQALRQLLVYSGDAGDEDDAALPCGRLEDWPDLSDRGYMLDVSRNRVPTWEQLLELLDFLMLLRYNHLELYLEHTFAYSAHREVWEGWSPLSAEEIRRLDAEAASRGIELVPNQNSFGHMTRWLEHASYRRLAECPDGFTDPWGGRRDYPFSLAPLAEGVDEFLAGLYDELLPNFSSRRFNVGLDETFDLGQGRSADAVAAEAARLAEAAGSADHEGSAPSRASGAPSSDETAAELHAAARGRIYLDFLRRVHGLVTAREHRMLFWADIIQNHPELVPELPEGVLAVEWGYDADHDFDTRCRRLAEAGVDFMVAPGTSLWNSVGGRYHTATVNIRRAVHAALRHGGRGMLITDWGDNGHIPPPVLATPALAFAGALSWHFHAEGEASGHSEEAAARPIDTLVARPPSASDTSTPGLEDAGFEWVRRFVLHRASAKLADALRLLNTLDRHDPVTVPNASILGVALFTFNNPAHRAFLDGLAPGVPKAIAQDLDRVRKLLAATEPVDAGGKLYRQELQFAADLGDYALQLLTAHRHRRGVAPLDPEEAAQVDEAVRRGYADLSARLATLWPRRSRPGGLRTSLADLARAPKALGILSSEDAAGAGAGAPSSAV